jgi:acyl-coenzyme A synthetase/AMP-(fatty) acid ligase
MCDRRYFLVCHSKTALLIFPHPDLVASYRQTETGSIVVTPFPGAIETKPGSATVPFFGHDLAILDAVSGKVCLL